MPVILCEEVAGNYQLFCESCHIPLDVVSPSVLRDLYPDYTPVLCMDCDGRADETPPHLLSNETPYILILGGKSIQVDPWQTARCHAERAKTWQQRLTDWLSGKRFKERTEKC